MQVLVVERDVAGDLLGLAHDLDLDALDADIVEYELGARGALVVDTGADAEDLVLVVLAGLEVAEIGGELADVIVDFGSEVSKVVKRKWPWPRERSSLPWNLWG